jgi:hypothetical protein
MNSFELSRLAPELIVGNQVWKDYIDALDDTLESNVNQHIRVLEFLRHLEYSPELRDVFYSTARMLGFDLTQDFMQLNADALAKLVVQLSRFGETAGTDNFVAFLGFVLGRALNVRPLFTNNYTDFYPVPAGTLNIDGGSWYKTTHVELEINLTGLDGQILVSPSESLLDRVMSLFYEFCPITYVVKNVFFTAELNMDICFCGKALVFPMLYLNSHVDNPPVSVSVVGPDSMIEFDNYAFSLIVTFQDGETHECRAHKWETDDADTLVDLTGACHAPIVDGDRQVNITGYYMGVSGTSTVTIVDAGVTSALENVEIVGPDIIEENTVSSPDEATVFTANGIWTDGSITPVDVTWELAATPIATIDSTGKVLTGPVGIDTTIEIQATADVAGGAMTVTRQITVRNRSNAVTHIVIVGPATIQESQQGSYYVEVNYSDNSKRRVYDPIWRLYTDRGQISSEGLVNVYSLESNTLARLEAIYEENEVVVRDARNIEFLSVESDLINLSIHGPSQVKERGAFNFNLYGSWSDGSTTKINPDWESSYFSIDANGVFRTGIVDGSMIVTLTARFVRGDTVDDVEVVTKDVTVLKNSIIPQEINIRAVSQINVGDSLPSQCYLVWSDGSETDITNLCIWSVDNSRATMDNYELSVADDFTEYADTFHVVASYTYTFPTGVQQEFEDIKLMYVSNVRATAKRAKAIEIIEPPSVIFEYDIHELSVEVTYEDGTKSIIQPRWEAKNVDVNVEEDICEIDHTGRLYARTVEVTSAVWVIARFMSVETSIMVNVMPTNYPSPQVSSVRIQGDSDLDCESTYYYNMWVSWEGCPNETPVSPSWELHELNSIFDTNPILLDPDVATVDCSGIVRTSNVQQSFHVVAKHECASGQVYMRSMVASVSCDYGQLISHKILGPDRIPHQNTTSVYLEATYTSGIRRYFEALNWAINADSSVIVATITPHYAEDTNRYYGNVAVATLGSDINASIIANWIDSVTGATIQTTKDVVLEAQDVPTSLSIEGPDQVTETELANYGALVFYGASDIEEVTTDQGTIWTSNASSVASFEAKGALRASNVSADTNVLLTCTWSYPDPVHPGETRTIEGHKNVLILDSSSGQAYITIEGPSEVNESSTGTFTLQLVIAGESPEPVGAGISWSLVNASGKATIDGSGVVVTASVSADHSFSVHASYEHSGNTLTASKDVVIRNIPQPTSMVVSGPTDVQENGTYSYEALVTDDDGVVTNRTSESVWSVDNAIATISGGSMTVGEVGTDTSIVVSATYTPAVGGAVADGLGVTVHDQQAAIPRWGLGSEGFGTESDILGLPNIMTDTFASSSSDAGTHDFIATTTGLYLYYAVPKALVPNWSRNAGAPDSGIVFYNLDAGGAPTGLSGGIDGANWDGVYGTSSFDTYEYGAKEVLVNGSGGAEIWLLYRTDFPLFAAQGYRVVVT